MFYYIEGVVAEAERQMAVIDCGGVGYQLQTTANTLADLKRGEKKKLYTYLHVREDIFELYGFSTLQEKSCFTMLLTVSGIGPKAALSILSAGTPESVAMAIITEDYKLLTAAPGVGKKIAQRVVLELKDKMSRESESFVKSGGSIPITLAGAGGGKAADAKAALAVLGYGQDEIQYALKQADMEADLEDIIRQALKKMVK